MKDVRPTAARDLRAAAAFLILALAACTTKRPASLAEPLGVEQPGGTVSQLVAQGSELPTSATESFTTARDGETRLQLHVVRGAGKSAGKLTSEGWWEVGEVSAAKAGEAKVVVTFELDARGQLAVSARENNRRLPATKLGEAPGDVTLSPLTEPDDQDEAADELE
jgi:molecular chaperone DnaK (HSP70)